jgi:predicted RNase H-like HicB family nuclease
MATFIAIVRTDGRYRYTAAFPDFPGCTADGPTLDDVIARAKEALSAHIQGLLDGNQKICSPAAADAIERGDALLLAAIDVPDELRAVQIDVAIPALALVRIDSFAQRRGLSRAALFVESVDRWAMQEAALRDRREGTSDGPTLFDFRNPLELRVETFERDVAYERGVAYGDTKTDELVPMEDLGLPRTADDVTSELARLLDGSLESRSTDEDLQEEQSPQAKPR